MSNGSNNEQGGFDLMNSTVRTLATGWNLTDDELWIAHVNNIIYYSLMIPVAVCGNIFTLTAVIMVLKTKKNIPNLLIGVLSCTDLLSVFTCHLISLAHMAPSIAITSTPLCHFQALMAYTYFKMGFLTKCCISFDRFIALSFPLRYRRLVTMKRVVAVIIHNIIISIGTTALTLTVDGEYITELSTWRMCVTDFSFYSSYKLAILVSEGAIFTLGVIIFFLSNITVIRVVRKLNKKTKIMFSVGKVAPEGELEQTKTSSANATNNNNISYLQSTEASVGLSANLSPNEGVVSYDEYRANNSSHTKSNVKISNGGQSIGGQSNRGTALHTNEYHNKKESVKSKHKEHKRQEKELQLAKLVTIIVTVFVILWLPYMVR